MRDYIETYSGMKVYLPECDPESIELIDIAHALSMVPRFAGHIDSHYSVAEHSIHVASIVPDQHKLQGLMHDGPEAYLSDIATPFKSLMPQYKELEADLWSAMCARFGIDEEMSPFVKAADRVMLMTERDYLKSNYSLWSDYYEETQRLKNWEPIRMWFGLKRASPSYIEGLFIEKFTEYYQR